MSLVRYVFNTKGCFDTFLLVGAATAGGVGAYFFGKEVQELIDNMFHNTNNNLVEFVKTYGPIIPPAIAVAGALISGTVGRFAGRGIDYFLPRRQNPQQTNSHR